MHLPVMKKEVLFYLEPHAGGLYVDGTVGGGGHAKGILELSAPDGFLVGIDLDQMALAKADQALATFKGRYLLIQGNYKDMDMFLRTLPNKAQPVKADGILLDLGMSSFQLEDETRGFSFLQEGPLDMRMDVKGSLTAEIIVNRWSYERLREIIAKYGEEKWAKRIAQKIVNIRQKTSIKTTRQLAEIVASAIPRRFWPRRIHPATRTFQALRIAVNQELENLEAFLNKALDCLDCGGRLVIISFHSLEDRLVKRAFKNWSQEGWVRLLTKKPINPSEAEITFNPRSRSAKLRAVEKII